MTSPARLSCGEREESPWLRALLKGASSDAVQVDQLFQHKSYLQKKQQQPQQPSRSQLLLSTCSRNGKQTTKMTKMWVLHCPKNTCSQGETFRPLKYKKMSRWYQLMSTASTGIKTCTPTPRDF
eukprot:732204-Amphidinium_carterae.2